MSEDQSKNRETSGKQPRWAGLWLFVGIASTVILLDQITKMVVLKTIGLYESIPVIHGFFNLTHIRNPGGAFGFMASGNLQVRAFLFLGVSMFALVLIIYFYKSIPLTHRLLRAALSMIFGGAVGNIIDRIRFREVVDFLDFYMGSYHWPAFNVADSAITVGITVLIVHIVFKKMPENA